MRRRISHRAIFGMLPVLAAGIIGVTAANPAMAAQQSIPPNSFSYYNEGNPSNCLDADISNINSNGDPVRLEPCTGGTNQKWYRSLQYPGEVVNAMSGLCLEADNNNVHTNGDVVQEWACWDGANQLWTGGSYIGEIVNEASGPDNPLVDGCQEHPENRRPWCGGYISPPLTWLAPGSARC